jgi:hypothetical protein
MLEQEFQALLSGDFDFFFPMGISRLGKFK